MQLSILSGLDSAYDAVVTALTASLEHLNMDDFQAQLNAFEIRLEAQQQALQVPPPMANVAQSTNRSSTQRRSYPTGSNNNRSSPSYQQLQRASATTGCLCCCSKP
ncbi:hypothetical protein BVC80_5993g2 [Macleaya cordata]|uniref:Uncharacterized protein n=1 Tax=Macleaya cordata TaxID=56857 RepID=A0A200PZ19_MACCD|nr:hypothetical protein BVC80_5993g2 [Macleaya cordata]